MSDKIKQELFDMCLRLAREIQDESFSSQLNEDGESKTAYDWLDERSLDIEYVVSRKGEYLGASILVAFGGPNIWINTRWKTVNGAWGSDQAEVSYYEDAIGLDDACEELWNCR